MQLLQGQKSHIIGVCLYFPGVYLSHLSHFFPHQVAFQWTEKKTLSPFWPKDNKFKISSHSVNNYGTFFLISKERTNCTELSGVQPERVKFRHAFCLYEYCFCFVESSSTEVGCECWDTSACYHILRGKFSFQINAIWFILVEGVWKFFTWYLSSIKQERSFLKPRGNGNLRIQISVILLGMFSWQRGIKAGNKILITNHISTKAGNIISKLLFGVKQNAYN